MHCMDNTAIEGVQPDYNSMSDSSLAAACRDDPKVISVLVKRYIPFIRRKAEKYETDSVSADDLASEGLLAFVKAVNSFNESKSSNFKGFVSVCVSNRMISIIRSQGNAEIADDEIEAEDYNTPESICIEKELNSEIESVLSKREYQILMYYLEGESYSEIADRMGIKAKAVDNAVQRVRKKLKGIFS